MKVVKFGGTSLATGAAVKQALNIITADPARQIVVVSAPGKRHDGDIKVTDLLIRYANETINGEDTAKTVQEIFERYETIGHFFDLPDEKIKIIKELLVDLPKKDYPNDEYLLAAFKAHGERLNARLIAMIMNRKASKWNGIRAIAESEGFAAAEVVAFGDDYNDEEMLRGCGRGIAMANALDVVKEAADEVCLSNEEDGVAKWIEENILKAT